MTLKSNKGRYMIRSQANTPTRVQLRDPATQEETGDWIDVRSSLSDKFIETRNLLMGSVGELSPDKETRKAEAADRQLRLKASLVSGWSFSEKPSEEEVIEFLREAPQVGEMLISVADEGDRFFSKPSVDSTDGQKLK